MPSFTLYFLIRRKKKRQTRRTKAEDSPEVTKPVTAVTRAVTQAVKQAVTQAVTEEKIAKVSKKKPSGKEDSETKAPAKLVPAEKKPDIEINRITGNRSTTSVLSKLTFFVSILGR